MDPLSLLRDCVAHRKPWRIEGEEVVFGDGPGAHRVKKDEPTAWRKRAAGRKGRSVCAAVRPWVCRSGGGVGRVDGLLLVVVGGAWWMVVHCCASDRRV